ncbi:MAG: hypothetical protein DCC68_13595 [Planctomycetota bacterium]|nr:MAG: hypothetical protein DCC68_13595 [Planctomycetota bacterium]
MNAQRLVRQLKREIKTNPKRAALLAGLTAVGIYFWAPLVAGWVMPEQAATAPVKQIASRAPTPAGATPAGATTAQPSKTTNATPWTQLWAAIQDDKRTKPATALLAAADPFRPFPAPPETNEETEESNQGNPSAEGTATAKRPPTANPAAAVEVTPKSLGMKLTGTVIGPRQRAAVIDGKIVPEGGLVLPAAADGKSSSTKTDAAKIAFRLVKVDDRSIALERNQKKYTLSIETPTADGIELEVIPPGVY